MKYILIFPFNIICIIMVLMAVFGFEMLYVILNFKPNKTDFNIKKFLIETKDELSKKTIFTKTII